MYLHFVFTKQRIDYWLERVGLLKEKDVLIRQYSKGMKQRLHIARAMLHNPQILFMDEPTLGLDPQGTLDLREIMKEQKEQGKTIILTTHDMKEAEELCDEIAFIMDGKIIRQGTFEQLQDAFQDMYSYEIEIVHSPESLLPMLQSLPIEWKGMMVTKDQTNVLQFDVSKDHQGEETLMQFITMLTPYHITQVLRQKMDLRSMYLQLVNTLVHANEVLV
jgi:ABC-2 type transport system ATP-binding protein